MPMTPRKPMTPPNPESSCRIHCRARRRAGFGGAGDAVRLAGSAPISPWIVAPVSGAVAAALVIGVGWMLGWPAVQPVTTPPVPAVNAAAIDDLTARIAGLESKVGKPVADPAAAARVDGLEKSLAALRAQGDKLASALNDVKSAPRADGAAVA